MENDVQYEEMVEGNEGFSSINPLLPKKGKKKPEDDGSASWITRNDVREIAVAIWNLAKDQLDIHS